MSIDHCRVENNGYGIVVDGGGKITISDSVVSGNVHNGVWSRELGYIYIENSIVTNNETGIGAGSGSMAGVVVVSNTTIVGNRYGVSIANGSIWSIGNNRLAGNGVDGSLDTFGVFLR